MGPSPPEKESSGWALGFVLTVWPVARAGACRTLLPVGLWTRKEVTPLIGTALSTVPKVSANGVYYLDPAWGFVVSIHGYPCKCPVMSGAQGGSLLGSWYQRHPRAGHGQSSPVVCVFWVSLVLCPLLAPVP